MILACFGEETLTGDCKATGLDFSSIGIVMDVNIFISSASAFCMSPVSFFKNELK